MSKKRNASYYRTSDSTKADVPDHSCETMLTSLSDRGAFSLGLSLISRLDLPEHWAGGDGKRRELNSPRCGKDADAGLTRLRVPTTSLGEGCSSVCRPCAGLHGNGQPAPPSRTPRMPSASTMSGDWPATCTLLRDEAAAANREWCWCCCCCCWWRCCNVDG